MVNYTKFVLWSLTAKKIRRDRFEFDSISLEVKCLAEDEQKLVSGDVIVERLSIY